MYITLLTKLVEPILFDKISEIEIRKLVESNHYELFLMAPKLLLPILIGKKGKSLNSLSTILASKAAVQNHSINLIISEF